MKLSIGDVISYKFDDVVSVGVVTEFDEDDLQYKFFTQEGETYDFYLSDQDDMNRVVFQGKNVFDLL